jgi:hypothetical protein
VENDAIYILNTVLYSICTVLHLPLTYEFHTRPWLLQYITRFKARTSVAFQSSIYDSARRSKEIPSTDYRHAKISIFLNSLYAKHLSP